MKQLPRRFREPLRFALTGAAATCIHYAAYWALKTALPVGLSYTIGYAVSLACNFYLSSVFTFRRKPSVRRGTGFLLSHVINYALQIGLLTLFLRWGISENWAPMPVYAITIPVNFLLVRHAIKRL